MKGPESSGKTPLDPAATAVRCSVIVVSLASLKTETAKLAPVLYPYVFGYLEGH
jgi:hypothetical protein